ncbi:MAG: hypothetical protein P8Y36_07395 [Alphaproteobacteria bacterium]
MNLYPYLDVGAQQDDCKPREHRAVNVLNESRYETAIFLDLHDASAYRRSCTVDHADRISGGNLANGEPQGLAAIAPSAFIEKPDAQIFGA